MEWFGVYYVIGLLLYFLRPMDEIQAQIDTLETVYRRIDIDPEWEEVDSSILGCLTVKVKCIIISDVLDRGG